MTSASSPISGIVTLTNNDVAVIRLWPNGWARGLTRGFGTVTAASPAAPATVEISIQVFE